MIINTKIGFVWIDIPKCASSTLDEFFFNFDSSTRRQFKHCRVVPDFAKDFIKIHAVRNPYTWLLSHYYRVKRYNLLKCDNFNNYLDHVVKLLEYSDDHRDGTIYQFYPAHKYVNPIGKIDHVIHVETMKEDLLKIPFVTGEPNNSINIGEYDKNLKEYYTSQEILDKANFWAGEDFEKYGYKKITVIKDIIQKS